MSRGIEGEERIRKKRERRVGKEGEERIRKKSGGRRDEAKTSTGIG